jgi:flagellar hook-associated protein 3 FlgL
MSTSDFRVTNQMLMSQSVANLQTALAKMVDLQDEASSLKRLRKPSDGPADVAAAMQLHSGIAMNDQYSKNIDDATAWLGSADSALTSFVTQLQQVNSLVLQAANGATDQNARNTIANQIDQIRQSLIGLANTQYGGRAIFAGTAGGTGAYAADGTYIGIQADVERTIAPGQRVQVNVNGTDAFGQPGSDIFNTLSLISNAIRTDPSQLSSLSTTLDTQTTNVQQQLASVGARYQRVSAMQTQNSSDSVTMKKNLSNLEDADIAQVLTDLQTQQTAYQAALQVTAQAIQPSLADFIK